jgi:hypothetical protein
MHTINSRPASNSNDASNNSDAKSSMLETVLTCDLSQTLEKNLSEREKCVKKYKEKE